MQLFFIISAFLTWKSLAKYPIQTSKEKGKWLLGKWVRLAPAYLMALTLFLCYTRGAAEYTYNGEGGVNALNIISHILMLHFVNPYWMNTFFGEWYLGDLVVFYVLSILSFRRIQDLKSAAAAFAASLGVGFLAECLIRIALVKAGIDDPILNVYFYNFSPLHELPVWFLGVLVYYLLPVLRKNQWGKYGWAFLIVGFYGLTYCVYVSQALVPAEVLIALFFLTFTLGTALQRFPLISNPVFDFFGKHSYGIYLFHVLFLYVLEEHGFSWAARVPAAIGIALFLDIVFNYLFFMLGKSIRKVPSREPQK